jgi:diacylglycerol O-acyltransferase
VVDGLNGGRGALIVRIHHALADGIAGAAILNMMFDSTSESLPPLKPPVPHAPAPPSEHSIVHAVASAIHSSLKNMLAAEAALLDLGQALLTDRMQAGLKDLLKLMPEWAKPIERLPFNRPCGAERKFCWAEIDFASVATIREQFGGTVNDVILAIVTRAVARYTKFHGQPVANRFVRIVCPVNVRHGDGRSPGNQITFLPVVLPLDVKDPAELLQAVSTRMEIMKSVRASELVAIAGAWIGATPPPVQALFWEGLPLIPFPLPLFNLICTNIPGSPTALYSLGRRMLASYPQVPTGQELGIGVAVQSYDGKMFFGLTADAHAAPDVTRLRDYLQAAFRDLCRAAGVKKPRPKPSARRTSASAA